MQIGSFLMRAVQALDQHVDAVRRYETYRLYGARREMWLGAGKRFIGRDDER